MLFFTLKAVRVYRRNLAVRVVEIVCVPLVCEGVFGLSTNKTLQKTGNDSLKAALFRVKLCCVLHHRVHCSASLTFRSGRAASSGKKREWLCIGSCLVFFFNWSQCVDPSAGLSWWLSSTVFRNTSAKKLAAYLHASLQTPPQGGGLLSPNSLSSLPLPSRSSSDERNRRLFNAIQISRTFMACKLSVGMFYTVFFTFVFCSTWNSMSQKVS